MSLTARIKSKSGIEQGSIPTIVSATGNINLPNSSDVFLVSGSSKIDYLNQDRPVQPGREIILIGASGGTASLDNVNSSSHTGKGFMDLGGSDRNVAADDVVKLVQVNDGTWRLSALVDN